MARRRSKERPVAPVDDDIALLATATRDRLALVARRAEVIRPQAASLPVGSYERHHILFRKSEWNSGAPTKMLREHVALMPKLEVGAHNELHANPELRDGVPLLGQEMARRVLQRFEGSPGDGLQSTEELLRIVESEKVNTANPRTQRLIAEATMIALDVQRPYLHA